MQAYRYKAFDSTGKKIEGEVLATSIEEVERKMSVQGVSVIAIFPASAIRKLGAEVPKPKARTKKVPDADLAAALRDMAVMSESGVPFVETIDAVAETARNRMVVEGMKRLREEIVGGRGLSGGMKAAGIFPNVVSEMVRVAEEGGRLDIALSSAADYMERSADMRKKIMNAMLYPIVLTTVAFGTIVVLLTFVLPRFANIFKSMKADIPPSTQMLLNVGEWLKSNPIIAVGTVAALVVGTKLMWRVPRVKDAIFSLLLKLPGIGPLLARIGLSRSLQSVATLLGTNISLLSALEHGASVAGSPQFQRAWLRARSAVEHGAALSDSMRETKIFPPSIVQMVSVGERTGKLAPLMGRMADHMETDVDSRLKALISLIEPAMIVIMGLIVGGITMSIIIPMYSVVQNAK